VFSDLIINIMLLPILGILFSLHNYEKCPFCKKSFFFFKKRVCEGWDVATG
jgi:hypothetical protein